MISMLVGSDGKLLEGSTLIGPDWSSERAWRNVLHGLRDRARKVGAREIIVCEGDTTTDAFGSLAGRDRALWPTVYHEDNGLIIEDRRKLLPMSPEQDIGY